MIAAGKSPAKEKARAKARTKGAETFDDWAEKWLRGYQMADSTRDMRRSVYERELKPKFGNQKLAEITHEDLRALTDAIVERGGGGRLQLLSTPVRSCYRSIVGPLSVARRLKTQRI